jgi:hypothetical protein
MLYDGGIDDDGSAAAETGKESISFCENYRWHWIVATVGNEKSIDTRYLIAFDIGRVTVGS